MSSHPDRVYPDPTREHLPTGSAKQCRDTLYLDIDGIRHTFECEINELPGEHPGQPHMVQLEPVEDGDTVFLGWWRTEDGPPPYPGGRL